MKKLFAKAKKAFVDFFKWLWTECKDIKTLILFGIVCLVISSPIWIGYILGFIFNWEAAFWFSTAMWAFWLMPGAPFLAIAVAVTLGVKKFLQFIFRKKRKNGAKENASAQETAKNSDEESI